MMAKLRTELLSGPLAVALESDVSTAKVDALVTSLNANYETETRDISRAQFAIWCANI